MGRRSGVGGGAAPVVVHLAPHPDDELLGAPATLMALRDAGWRVLNVACGLGRPADAARRRVELERACRRAGFELQVLAGAPALGTGDGAATEARLAERLGERIAATAPALVVGPSPHDGHHGHELVGRATAAALQTLARPARWMMWGLWAEPTLPNLLVSVSEARLDAIAAALSAHAGELARNDYARLVRARAHANAVLGVERVLGFGTASAGDDGAELLTDAVYDAEHGWRWLAPRRLDPARPLDGEPVAPLDWWLRAPSARATLAAVRGSQ